MNTKNTILLFVCGMSSFFVSCSESMPFSEEEYQKSYIRVNPSSLTLDEDDTQESFTVYCSGNWRISSSPYWVNLSQSYGYGYGYVSFTVDENTGNSDRSGYIRLETDDGFSKTESIKITQPPTKKFEVSMSHTNYIAAGDWWYLEVKAPSSKSWRISKSASWVHLSYSGNTSSTYYGNGDESVKIYVDRNSGGQRSTTLTVTCGSDSKYITISQDSGSSDEYLSPSYWTSTNKANSTTDYKEWSFYAYYGDVLSFYYSVSSEAGYDVFNAKLSGALSYTLVDKASGTETNKYVSYRFTKSGSYTLRMEYVKDSTRSDGSDQVSVSSLKITRN